jgi:hypothetical protein
MTKSITYTLLRVVLRLFTKITNLQCSLTQFYEREKSYKSMKNLLEGKRGEGGGKDLDGKKMLSRSGGKRWME